MLEVTRLNGQKVVINSELIEYIDANPDTTITLTTTNKFVVKESVKDVIDKIISYKKKIYFNGVNVNTNTKEEE